MGAIFLYTGEAAKTKEMIEEGRRRNIDSRSG